MGIMSWFRKSKASPTSDYELDDVDREDGQKMIRLKKELRRLDRQRREQSLQDQIDEGREELGLNSSGDDMNLDSVFTSVLMQKLGITSPQQQSNIQVSPNFERIQNIFVQWARDNQIPEDKLVNLKARLEKDLNT